MFDVAVSQLTMPRWGLSEELAAVAAHGFVAISLWRPKLSDVGVAAAVETLAATGIRVSSLQAIGGFTGSEGRTFAESLADGLEAIATAAALRAACPFHQAPVVVVHSGCRSGHTRSHAVRLLVEALESLAPAARREGVVLAVKPLHAGAAAGCSFLTRVADALDLVERFAHPHVRLALDLWHFADEPAIDALLPRLAAATALVNVADRDGGPEACTDRLPAGRGALPLESVVCRLVESGYQGDIEFDPVGETVQELGYAAALAETRRVSAVWMDRLAGLATGRSFRVDLPHDTYRGAQRRGAAGSRRSQASTQAVSRG